MRTRLRKGVPMPEVTRTWHIRGHVPDEGIPPRPGKEEEMVLCPVIKEFLLIRSGSGKMRVCCGGARGEGFPQRWSGAEGTPHSRAPGGGGDIEAVQPAVGVDREADHRVPLQVLGRRRGADRTRAGSIFRGSLEEVGFVVSGVLQADRIFMKVLSLLAGGDDGPDAAGSGRRCLRRGSTRRSSPAPA